MIKRVWAKKIINDLLTLAHGLPSAIIPLQLFSVFPQDDWPLFTEALYFPLFQLLEQNTSDMVVYKQQKFTAHSHKWWKSMSAWLGQGFLGGDRIFLYPNRTEKARELCGICFYKGTALII